MPDELFGAITFYFYKLFFLFFYLKLVPLYFYIKFVDFCDTALLSPYVSASAWR